MTLRFCKAIARAVIELIDAHRGLNVSTKYHLVRDITEALAEVERETK